MQIFVRGLSGKHFVLDMRPWQTMADVKVCVEAHEGIPFCEQRLTFLGRYLHDRTTVESAGLSPNSTVTLLLPLLGGKGGFGSNLRAAGKARLTDNFDACRDLQGRRIRHKTAAQKLEEWQAEASERELETVALRHLKQVEKEERRQQEVEVDVKKVRAASKETLAGVQSAVQHALLNSASAAEIREGGGGGRATKRRKMDPLLEDISSSRESSRDSDDGEEAAPPKMKGKGKE